MRVPDPEAGKGTGIMEGEMGTSLAAVSKETRLAHPLEFSTEQTRILAETVAKGCDQNELAFFLNVCKIKRLDPFTGQVHCVKRWDRDMGREKMAIQVGIDGFRVIAARSNELAGISEPEFDTEEESHPNWAHVVVYRYGRENEKIPYAAKARYSEYVQTKKDGTPNHMWANKPYIMLGKCAEALALRKAFPDELSGMYSDEEMAQADSESGVTPASVDKKKPPVTMPGRASEKKTAEATQTTQQGQQAASNASEKEISGIIESAKQAKSGTLWVTVKGEPLVAAVDEKNIDADMVVGNFIKFRGVLKFNEKLATAQNPKGEFLSLAGLIELSPVQDGEPAKTEADKNAPLAEDASKVADEMFGKGEGQAVIEDLKKNGHVTTASTLPEKKKGTIGKGRRLRLLGICNTNKAHNNGFNYDEIKKILAALPVPVEHIEHMEEGLYPQFEKWAAGEEDFREFWKEN
jgi:phage recombination protein Bet